jgi:CxxC motif-containing protein (DUF1111 family)
MNLPRIRCEQSRLVFKRALAVTAVRAFALSIDRNYCISNKSAGQAEKCLSERFFVDTLNGMKKRGRGRPPKEADRLRSESLLVRLETTEKKTFQEAANLAGVPLSTWVRERLRQVAVRELGKASRPVAFLKHAQ